MFNLLEKYLKNYGGDNSALKKYYLFNTLLNMAESTSEVEVLSVK